MDATTQNQSNIQNPNNDFYNFIVELTKYSTTGNLLKMDSDVILNVILKDYRKNLQVAASKGFNKAYICIYEIGAKYKNIIPIDEYIRPSDSMKEKFEKFKIEPVVDRVKKALAPFNVEVKSLDEVDLIPNQFNSEEIIRIDSDNNEKKDDDVLLNKLTSPDNPLRDKLEMVKDNDVDRLKKNFIGISVVWEKKG